MKNKRLCKVWSKRHLPADLWPQILSRLPVKSLLRFRRVSKSWLSLIDNAEFARLHLNNFKNNRDEAHLFVVQGKRQDCVVRCSDIFKTNSETLLTLGRMYRQGSWHFVCSIDGLVLLKSGTRSDVSGLSDLKMRRLALATIHSWKIIPFQGKGSSCSNWRWRPNFFDMKEVYFCGSLYFIANDDSNRVLDLVSFDLSSEVFSVISLPEHFYDYHSEYKGFHIALIDGGCTLAVSDFDSCVWVLEDSGGEGDISDSDSNMGWTTRYEFDLAIIDILHIKKNSDIRSDAVLRSLANKHENVKQRWDVFQP